MRELRGFEILKIEIDGGVLVSSANNRVLATDRYHYFLHVTLSTCREKKSIPHSQHLLPSGIVLPTKQIMKYSFIPALSTFAIFLVGMRNGTSVNAIECLDTEALVRVSYVPALDHKHYDSSIGTSVQIRPSTSADESFSMNFTDVQNVNDVEVCVTKENACVQIGVAGPAPTSAFTATWDGDEIDLGSELGANFKYDDNKELDYFKAFASTEYGEGCKLPCNEDEAQFEYHYRATDDAFDTHTKQYLVEDGNGKIIIERPMFFGNPSKYLLFTEKKCLPKNDCYRFIAGSYFQPLVSSATSI